MADKDILDDAKERFKLSADAESDNRQWALEDIEFARLGKQWPDDVVSQRKNEGRPCLTINRLPAFARQIVNDARQNKPAIKVKPADSGADVKTAEIYNGLIRNIEVSSNAEIAYDTALECAVYGGFGYWRVKTDYAHDDTFDLDLCIERVANPFTVYGDPKSQAADASDWRWGFVTELLSRDEFASKYGKNAKTISWSADKDERDQHWQDEDKIRVAEHWVRDEVTRPIVKLSTGIVLDADAYKASKALFDAQGIVVVGERETRSWKVTQHILTGAEVLESVEWSGRYIPIIPVYGDEVNVEGKRYFRSLVRDVRDAQLMYNYWRPLALDTPIPTPAGWSTMGALRVGDKVFDEQGKPCNVIGKSPVHINRNCFRVEFDDGSHIVADASHPWVVEERGRRTASGWTWTTKEVTTDELRAGRHFIWASRPLDRPEAKLPIDPYVFGFWLGDGDSTSGRLTPGDGDLDEVVSLVRAAGHEIGAVPKPLPERHRSVTVLGIRPELRKLGVLGRKHIPMQYLHASAAQRWALLQGLMDSDGSIHRKTRACVFTTTNKQLADEFAELIRSLGIKVKRIEREGRRSMIVGAGSVVQSFSQFGFSLGEGESAFRLTRKRAMQNGGQHPRRTKRHTVVRVVPVPSVPVQCIAIDAPSHLFLAGESMVPTHNTATAELVALAPKAPFIGEQGSFDNDPNWKTANTKSHAYLEYKKGAVPPQRQPFAGVPAGAMQEALTASDDMKAILGIYDASLGARSNETSGRAIMARQREGDVSTFHYIDNLSRAIRYCGRVLIDLIPTVYNAERMIRVLGEDGAPKVVQIAAGQEQMPPGVYDLTRGKYDLVVESGPSYTTKREEINVFMTEVLRANPATAPLLMDVIVRNMDFPESDKIAARFKAMLPPPIQALEQQDEDGQQAGVIAQQLVQAQMQIQQMQQALQQAEIQRTQLDAAKLQQEGAIEKARLDLEARKVELDKYQAELDANVKVYVEQLKIGAQQESQAAQMQAEDRRAQPAADAAMSERMSNESLMAAVQEIMGGLSMMRETNAAQMQAMQALVQAANAPKRVVRDPVTNRAIGVEPVPLAQG